MASAETIAKAVEKRLMNGPLREMRADMESGFSELKEIVSATAAKVDDLHGWMSTLDQRVSDLEDDRR